MELGVAGSSPVDHPIVYSKINFVMAIIIVDKNPEKQDIKKSREDYPDYIKITVTYVKELLPLVGNTMQTQKRC